MAFSLRNASFWDVWSFISNEKNIQDKHCQAETSRGETWWANLLIFLHISIESHQDYYFPGGIRGCLSVLFIANYCKWIEHGFRIIIIKRCLKSESKTGHLTLIMADFASFPRRAKFSMQVMRARCSIYICKDRLLFFTIFMTSKAIKPARW